MGSYLFRRTCREPITIAIAKHLRRNGCHSSLLYLDVTFVTKKFLKMVDILVKRGILNIVVSTQAM